MSEQLIIITSQLIALFGFPRSALPWNVSKIRDIYIANTPVASIAHILTSLYEETDILVRVDASIEALPTQHLPPRLPPAVKEMIHFNLPPHLYVRYVPLPTKILSFFLDNTPAVKPSFAISTWTAVAPLGLIFCCRICKPYPFRLNTLVVEGWLITDYAAQPNQRRLEVIAYDFIIHQKHI
ncbi:hypothetical protein EUX98_g8299 [Antrodiella citrinella]|uniref:Uncharacterized protein n=1 Tax=Antrodiella citrinella TaxID=2447956 RepID=A0A4S4M8W1_9APHY|nr:hypothetical protein EUX98_g8299 [Antrodiella citrinella]